MIAGAHPLERVTASDLFLLLRDDYGWSSDIGGLAVLDGTGLLDRDGRVRIGAVRDQLEPRLPLVPRFRQLLCRPGPPCCHTPGNSTSPQPPTETVARTWRCSPRASAAP